MTTPINRDEFLHASLVENDLTINVSALNLPLFPASVKEMNGTGLKGERPRNRNVSRRPFWNWIDSSIVYETFRKFEVSATTRGRDSRIWRKPTAKYDRPENSPQTYIRKIKVFWFWIAIKGKKRNCLMKFILRLKKKINWLSRANKYW